jgi:hypothetical protein
MAQEVEAEAARSERKAAELEKELGVKLQAAVDVGTRWRESAELLSQAERDVGSAQEAKEAADARAEAAKEATEAAASITGGLRAEVKRQANELATAHATASDSRAQIHGLTNELEKLCTSYSILERRKRETDNEACEARETQRRTALELRRHREDAQAELEHQLSAEREAADAKATSLRAELQKTQAAGAALEQQLQAAKAKAAKAERGWAKAKREAAALEVQVNRLDCELQAARAPFQRKQRDVPQRETGKKSKINPAAATLAVLAHRHHYQASQLASDNSDNSDGEVVLPPPSKAPRVSVVLSPQEYIVPDNIVPHQSLHLHASLPLPSSPSLLAPNPKILKPLSQNPNPTPLSKPLPPVQSRRLSTQGPAQGALPAFKTGAAREARSGPLSRSQPRARAIISPRPNGRRGS